MDATTLGSWKRPLQMRSMHARAISSRPAMGWSCSSISRMRIGEVAPKDGTAEGDNGDDGAGGDEGAPLLRGRYDMFDMVGVCAQGVKMQSQPYECSLTCDPATSHTRCPITLTGAVPVPACPSGPPWLALIHRACFRLRACCRLIERYNPRECPPKRRIC